MHSAPPVNADSLGTIDEPPVTLTAPAKTAAVRQYPGRTCQTPFSSSSNRMSHERQIHAIASAAVRMNCLSCDKPCFGQRALQLHAQDCRGVARAAAAAEPASTPAADSEAALTGNAPAAGSIAQSALAPQRRRSRPASGRTPAPALIPTRMSPTSPPPARLGPHRSS